MLARIFLFGLSLGLDHVQHHAFVTRAVFGAIGRDGEFRLEGLSICNVRLRGRATLLPSLSFAMLVEFSLALVRDSLSTVNCQKVV